MRVGTGCHLHQIVLPQERVHKGPEHTSPASGAEAPNKTLASHLFLNVWRKTGSTRQYRKAKTNVCRRLEPIWVMPAQRLAVLWSESKW